MTFCKNIYILICGIIFSTSLALADVKINDGISHITEFATLDNNTASASLVWALNSQTKEQNRLFQALLAAKINGPIGNKSVGEIIDFRIINDISYLIDSSPNHLILTVQSPKENFYIAAKHTNEILNNTIINETWLKRKKHSFRNISSTRIRTTSLLENDLTNYFLFTGSDKVLTKEQINLNIARRPNQVILNAKDFNFNGITNILLKNLPAYDSSLNEKPNKPSYKIPSGIIHLEDKESTETLIFIGSIENFVSLTHQAESNTLFKYMGYGAGSEMFRIIRQENRASYDPRSHFRQIGDKLAFTGLSATVASETWSEIHSLIYEIYNNTRSGANTSTGLKNSHNTVINELISNLRRKPNWLVKRYLELHPIRPPEEPISLELIDASFNVSIEELNYKASSILSKSSNLISIIIGGKINSKLKANSAHYCQLPKKEALEFCLEKLSIAQGLR